MSSWSYGLVKEEGKTRIREVHWNDNDKVWAYTVLSFWDYIRDFFMITKDIYSQLKNYHIIDYKKEIYPNDPSWLKSLNKFKQLKKKK